MRKGKGTQLNFCNCKRSRCQKKYCVCFTKGRPCCGDCKCVDCFNKYQVGELPTTGLEENVNVVESTVPFYLLNGDYHQVLENMIVEDSSEYPQGSQVYEPHQIVGITVENQSVDFEKVAPAEVPELAESIIIELPPKYMIRGQPEPVPKVKINPENEFGNITFEILNTIQKCLFFYAADCYSEGLSYVVIEKMILRKMKEFIWQIINLARMEKEGSTLKIM
ncbi:uncharacterized protein LOC119682119 [Teleopsis dalmanni]|uniref:uncharacterized protein LOC119682119 n=1 Tax=Teleopsis dalmanni TaxID=139649 RepID=UPI0018CDB850|nr:uncharacterized protein LOC119682119 [Teleopsis dalmanni]